MLFKVLLLYFVFFLFVVLNSLLFCEFLNFWGLILMVIGFCFLYFVVDGFIVFKVNEFFVIFILLIFDFVWDVLLINVIILGLFCGFCLFLGIFLFVLLLDFCWLLYVRENINWMLWFKNSCNGYFKFYMMLYEVKVFIFISVNLVMIVEIVICFDLWIWF